MSPWGQPSHVNNFCSLATGAYLAIPALCVLLPPPLTETTAAKVRSKELTPLYHTIQCLSFSPKIKLAEQATDCSMLITYYK